MLCDKCKKNEANVHVTQYVNGVKYEQNLCGECAGMENGFGNFGSFGFTGFSDLLSGLREMSMIGVPVAMPENGGVQRPVPETNFEALGLKFPGEPETKKETDQSREKETKKRLEAELHAAVEKQEFEKAAELRDKLYFMEKKEKEKGDE